MNWIQKNNIYIGLLVLTLALVSCDDTSIPKPYGYFRTDMPEKAYEINDFPCAFTCELPSYTICQTSKKTIKDTCYFNIVYPQLNAKVYISYLPLKNNLGEMLQNANKSVYEHHIKANNIATNSITNAQNKVHGLVYELNGEVASNCQFFLTDSVNHFVRGALYFNNTPNADSLQPMVDFIREDIYHMANTMQWK